MNAVERLWRALAAHDWASARAQFHPNATVEWPHTGARLDVEEYLARLRARPEGGIDVGRVVSEGRFVAVEARAGTARCAAFYDLHDGLIASGVEYWVGEGA
jgi:ketosteroid isomerase-like protein